MFARLEDSVGLQVEPCCGSPNGFQSWSSAGLSSAPRESYFSSEWPAIEEWFEEIKKFEPDVVFTHYRDDRHQDHRVLSDLAWNTFRSHLILE